MSEKSFPFAAHLLGRMAKTSVVSTAEGPVSAFGARGVEKRRWRDQRAEERRVTDSRTRGWLRELESAGRSTVMREKVAHACMAT